MAYIHGSDGGATFATGGVAQIRDWSGDGKWGTEDLTTMGATGRWRSKRQTLRDVSGTINCVFDPDDTDGQIAALNEQYGAAPTGVVALELVMDSGTKLSGNAVVTGVGVAVKVDGYDTIAIQFESDGAWVATV